MISKLSSALVFTLAILTLLTEARTGDAVQVKLRYNLNFQASDSEVQDILKRADLESHGFIKEVSSMQVKEPGIDTAEYQESYLYYKVVNCSRTREVEQELDTLIPGIFGDNFASKLNKETNSTNKRGQCRVGLELIFRKPGNDFGRQTADMNESDEADEGSLKVNSDIGVGQKISNLWGGSRRRVFRRRIFRRRVIHIRRRVIHIRRRVIHIRRRVINIRRRVIHIRRRVINIRRRVIHIRRRVINCRRRFISYRRRFISSPRCRIGG